MSTDNNSKGILLIIAAMTLFAMQDSLIKFIFEKAALYEIFFGRYFVAAILLFGYIKFRGQKVRVNPKKINDYFHVSVLLLICHCFSLFFIVFPYFSSGQLSALLHF